MKRYKKFVLWLHNITDLRGDEWVVIWAKNRKEAAATKVEYDTSRFERGNVLTAHEFRVQVGIAAFHLFRAHDIW